MNSLSLQFPYFTNIIKQTARNNVTTLDIFYYIKVNYFLGQLRFNFNKCNKQLVATSVNF